VVRVALRSEAADLADLAPLVGVRYAPNGEAEKSAQALNKRIKAAEPQQPHRAEGVFPARPFRVEALRAVDARVTMNAVKLKATGVPMLESLRVAADLTDGVLELKPIDLGAAGGRLSGSVTCDGRGQAPSARAAIEIRNIQLEKLVPSLSAKARSTGAIRGQIRLAGQGNSIAAIFGNATGSLAARMEGGRISNLADAKLGLDGGKVLSLLLRGDRDIAIHCGAVAFDFRSGVGKSETIVLDTEQTHVDGTGTIDLREERLDLLLTPQPKKPGLFTRLASIRMHGSFGNVETSIQERVVLGLGGKAAPSHASRGNGEPPQEPCGAVR
jgi:AsmA family protein